MEWKRLAPWNWFAKEQPARQPAGDPWVGLRAEMDRAFQETLRGFGGRLPALGEALLRPSVDISERKKAYVVRVELPGAEKGDIAIEVEGDAVRVRGEKRQEREENDEHFHCVERRFGAFERLLALPADADADAIEAKFRNGVLSLTIPKREEDRPSSRTIDVRHD